MSKRAHKASKKTAPPPQSLSSQPKKTQMDEKKPKLTFHMIKDTLRKPSSQTTPQQNLSKLLDERKSDVLKVVNTPEKLNKLFKLMLKTTPYELLTWVNMGKFITTVNDWNAVLEKLNPAQVSECLQGLLTANYMQTEEVKNPLPDQKPLYIVNTLVKNWLMNADQQQFPEFFKIILDPDRNKALQLAVVKNLISISTVAGFVTAAIEDPTATTLTRSEKQTLISAFPPTYLFGSLLQNKITSIAKALCLLDDTHFDVYLREGVQQVSGGFIQVTISQWREAINLLPSVRRSAFIVAVKDHLHRQVLSNVVSVATELSKLDDVTYSKFLELCMKQMRIDQGIKPEQWLNALCQLPAVRRTAFIGATLILFNFVSALSVHLVAKLPLGLNFDDDTDSKESSLKSPLFKDDTTKSKAEIADVKLIPADGVPVYQSIFPDFAALFKFCKRNKLNKLLVLQRLFMELGAEFSGNLIAASENLTTFLALIPEQRERYSYLLWLHQSSLKVKELCSDSKNVRSLLGTLSRTDDSGTFTIARDLSCVEFKSFPQQVKVAMAVTPTLGHFCAVLKNLRPAAEEAKLRVGNPQPGTEHMPSREDFWQLFKTKEGSQHLGEGTAHLVKLLNLSVTESKKEVKEAEQLHEIKLETKVESSQPRTAPSAEPIPRALSSVMATTEPVELSYENRCQILSVLATSTLIAKDDAKALVVEESNLEEDSVFEDDGEEKEEKKLNSPSQAPAEAKLTKPPFSQQLTPEALRVLVPDLAGLLSLLKKALQETKPPATPETAVTLLCQKLTTDHLQSMVRDQIDLVKILIDTKISGLPLQALLQSFSGPVGKLNTAEESFFRILQHSFNPGDVFAYASLELTENRKQELLASLSDDYLCSLLIRSDKTAHKKEFHAVLALLPPERYCKLMQLCLATKAESDDEKTNKEKFLFKDFKDFTRFLKIQLKIDEKEKTPEQVAGLVAARVTELVVMVKTLQSQGLMEPLIGANRNQIKVSLNYLEYNFRWCTAWKPLYLELLAATSQCYSNMRAEEGDHCLGVNRNTKTAAADRLTTMMNRGNSLLFSPTPLPVAPSANTKNRAEHADEKKYQESQPISPLVADLENLNLQEDHRRAYSQGLLGEIYFAYVSAVELSTTTLKNKLKKAKFEDIPAITTLYNVSRLAKVGKHTGVLGRIAGEARSQAKKIKAMTILEKCIRELNAGAIVKLLDINEKLRDQQVPPESLTGKVRLVYDQVVKLCNERETGNQNCTVNIPG